MRVAPTLALFLGLSTWQVTGASDSMSLHLTSAQAIRLANMAARRAKLDLSHYHAPMARYDADHGVSLWRVSYDTDALDDCFWVTVDDLTKKTVLSMCAA